MLPDPEKGEASLDRKGHLGIKAGWQYLMVALHQQLSSEQVRLQALCLSLSWLSLEPMSSELLSHEQLGLERLSLSCVMLLQVSAQQSLRDASLSAQPESQILTKMNGFLSW